LPPVTNDLERQHMTHVVFASHHSRGDRTNGVLIGRAGAGLLLALTGAPGAAQAQDAAATIPPVQATAATPAAPLPQGFTSHFIDVNGASIHYVEGGSGSVVVLLHGWPQTWRAWRKLMPLLASRHHVIAVDMPGLGDSGTPSTGYDKRSLARDVRALLVGLGHQQVILVGHDLGAAVAYAFARQFPNAVTRLVVMDDPIPGLKNWDEVKGKWPRWHFAFHSVPGLPEALVSGRELAYLNWFYHNAYQTDAITDEDARLYAAAYARPAALHAGFEYYRAFDQDAADNARDDGPLPMPVLALGGDHSPWKSYLYEQLQGRAVSLQGAVVPDCGHFIPEEQPQWLAEQLRQFID
jgi:pimeloyl-ACP methyl ester carboxylesterase